MATRARAPAPRGAWRHSSSSAGYRGGWVTAYGVKQAKLDMLVALYNLRFQNVLACGCAGQPGYQAEARAPLGPGLAATGWQHGGPPIAATSRLQALGCASWGHLVARPGAYHTSLGPRPQALGAHARQSGARSTLGQSAAAGPGQAALHACGNIPWTRQQQHVVLWGSTAAPSVHAGSPSRTTYVHYQHHRSLSVHNFPLPPGPQQWYAYRFHKSRLRLLLELFNVAVSLLAVGVYGGWRVGYA